MSTRPARPDRTPPEVRGAPETWEHVAAQECVPLLAAVADADVTDAAALAALRRTWDHDVIAVAVELVRARRRAGRKFPNADRLVADVAGVEQATSALVADHKAGRFATIDAGPVHDLCCGIGGDAMALARATDVLAVDHDPVRAWMAGTNADCPVAVADVTESSPRHVVFHIDPSRRTAGGHGASRRLPRLVDYRPGPPFLARLLDACPDGAVKLGPGVDLDAVPGVEDGEIEIVNENEALVQVVLWRGRLALHPGRRTATRLPDGVSVSGCPGAPLPAPPTDRFGRFLVRPDPALERGRLVGVARAGLDLREAHPGLGLLTGDEPVASPWLQVFEVLEQMPWREARIRAWLRDHDCGEIVVRTRGGAVDPDRAQRKFVGDGREAFTVFGLRLGRRKVAVITRPVPRSASADGDG